MIKKIVISIMGMVVLTSTIIAYSWFQHYGGIAAEEPYNVIETTDHHYVFVGYTNSYGAGGNDIYLVKTDSLGDTVWTRTYGSLNNDCAYDIIEDSYGDILVTGTKYFSYAVSKLILLKINSLNGDTIWSRIIEKGNYCQGYQIIQSSDTTYLVGAGTDYYDDGEFFVISVDTGGDTLWSNHYGGADGEDIHAICLTEDGNYVLTGITMSYGSGLWDYYTVKINDTGDTLWTAVIGGSSFDNPIEITGTDDGGCAVAGYTYSFGTGEEQIYIVKYDSLGDTLWTKLWGESTQNSSGKAIHQTFDGGLIIGAFSEPVSEYKVSTFLWLIKTDQFGSIEWDRKIFTLEMDMTNLIQVHDSSFLICGCYMDPGPNGRQAYLWKTNQDGTGIDEDISSPVTIPVQINCISWGQINLSFHLDHPTNLDLRIFDQAGRNILQPFSGIYAPGDHQVEFSLPHGGEYFYLLRDEDGESSGKILMME